MSDIIDVITELSFPFLEREKNHDRCSPSAIISCVAQVARTSQANRTEGIILFSGSGYFSIE
jgi:hypothetical protein